MYLEVGMWSRRENHETYSNCACLEQPRYMITKHSCTQKKAHICQYGKIRLKNLSSQEECT